MAKNKALLKAKRKQKQSPEPVSPPVNQKKALDENLQTKKKWVEIFLLLLILLVSFYVRIEDLNDWGKRPELAFYKGEPLLTTFDGYYYLTLARDLAEGTYATIDDKRAVPDYPKRPFPPPLLSVMAAMVKKITPFSMNWIGTALPVLLGLLLAVPVYALGRFYGGSSMGLSAVLMALLSHYYVYRSSLGWFDTDCMNVTWATGISYCFLRFGIEKTTKRYIYFGAGIFAYLLFLWWWDSTPQVVTAVTAVPLTVALIFFYRPKAREGLIFYGIITACIFLVLSWKGLDLPVQIFNKISGIYSYIAKESSGFFPNTGISISEQVRPSLEEIVSRTTNSLPVLILSLSGLLWLFYKKPKESLFLSIPLLLSGLSFLFAKRFLIFLSPATALGLGFFISRLWHLKERHRVLIFIAPLAAILIASPAFYRDIKKTFWPKEQPFIIAGMDAAHKKTPENAVIWAWWDHGYPMIYWSRRGTISDGTFHGPERVVYNGLPMATHDFKFSANFMQFFVKRGETGIHLFYKALDNNIPKAFFLMKKILAVGPDGALGIIRHAGLKPVDHWKTDEDWLRFFFPETTRPVYLFLDYRLTKINYWWYWFGTWDPKLKDGIHPAFYRSFADIKTMGSHLKSGNELDVDLRDGIAVLGGNAIALKKIIINDGASLNTKEFHKNGLMYEALLKPDFAVLQDEDFSRSIFNMLFMRTVAAKRYFSPVELNSPFYQLWEVKGDKIN